jgi:RHS repeat-associated protein
VILRDDHEDDWTEAADLTLERRVFYCQNWRADVVALLAENGRVVERAWYEPYGTPHGLNPGDFGGTSSSGDDHYLVPDGDSDSDDATTYLALFGGSNALSDTTGSSDPGDGEYGRPNGVIDSDDYFYFLDRAGDAATLGRNVLSAGHDGATASHGAGNLRNRRGLAGYEWDPHVRRYHVRNRVLYPEIGRWTRRDPMGYVDGMGLYGYARSRPTSERDAMGLAVCLGRACNAPMPPPPPNVDMPADPLDDCMRHGNSFDRCIGCCSGKGYLWYVCAERCNHLAEDQGVYPPAEGYGSREQIACSVMCHKGGVHGQVICVNGEVVPCVCSDSIVGRRNTYYSRLARCVGLHETINAHGVTCRDENGQPLDKPRRLGGQVSSTACNESLAYDAVYGCMSLLECDNQTDDGCECVATRAKFLAASACRRIPWAQMCSTNEVFPGGTEALREIYRKCDEEAIAAYNEALTECKGRLP